MEGEKAFAEGLRGEKEEQESGPGARLEQKETQSRARHGVGSYGVRESSSTMLSASTGAYSTRP